MTEKELTEVSEKTPEERYKEYLKNLENVIDNHFKSIPDVSDDELSKLDESNYYSQSYAGATTDGLEYNISLGNDKILKLTIYNDNGLNNKNMVLDKGVLNYFVIANGNSGYKSLYYITITGKVYMIDVETNLEEPNNMKKEEINVKKIINILPAQGGLLSGYMLPIFIDIDGNAFNIDGEQLN